MLLADWRVQFPEFAAAPDALVQAFLDASELQVDAEVWGTLFDQGHGYLTAHKLALSPYGQAARLSKKGETTYYPHFKEMQAGVTGGWIRVC